MSRAVEEWVGKHDDAAVPPRVRARICLAHDGICHLSVRKIATGEPWDLDHVIALINGGEHRESNLAPALRDKHREKTKADVKIKAKSARIRQKHLGIRKPRTMTRWRTFSGEIVHASRDRT